MSRPLFSVGTARGGTNLLARMLSVHAEISVAADPYLPLFRSLRNGILRSAGDPWVQWAVPPDSVLDDYYFSRKKWAALDVIQKATLGVPFQESERPALLQALAARAQLSSSHVVPHLGGLRGSSYEDLFRSALEILEMAGGGGRSWVGFNENWAVEFLPALAASFPEAKFLILLRDPRGAIASALKEPDRKKVPHVISFARHWRKAVALMIKYRNQDLFQDRLQLIRYEDLVQEPERCARQACSFLGVRFEPGMLDTERYRAAGGGPWTGNSHQGGPASGIYTSSVRAWEKSLPPEAVELIEFICDPDMRLLGYEPVNRSVEEGSLGQGGLEFAERDARECRGWRSDLGEVERDIAHELLRRWLVQDGVAPPDPWWIRTCFLEGHLFEKLKWGDPVLLR